MQQLCAKSVSVLLVTCFAVSASAESLKLSGRTMGTYYSVVVDSPAESLGDGSGLRKKIEAALSRINTQMSTWDADSEISRFNKSQSTDWFAVSEEFAAVTTEAKRVWKLTDGAFDPTVEPLILLWGFGDDRRREIPEESEIEAALKQCGMQHLEVRADPPALRKSLPALKLNLSAIAKGYAVDVIAELLVKEGCPRFVVDIGGENRAGTAKTSGEPWRLGVEAPTGGIRRVLEVTESSVATSGDYRNNFQSDGVVYSHAISPTIGRPVENPPASVSVMHSSCMTADALATSMLVMNVEKGAALAEANSLSVFFQTVDSDGEITETAIGRFADQKSEANTDQAAGNAGKKSAGAAWFPFAAAGVIFLIAVAGMSIGAILQNKSLKGSCGGIASMPGNEGRSICELCTVPKDECTNAELRAKLQEAARCRETSDC